VLGDAAERGIEVLDADRDVPVRSPQLVRAPVVIEGQLQLGLVAGEPEEG
jgi:hypothetical protein